MFASIRRFFRGGAKGGASAYYLSVRDRVTSNIRAGKITADDALSDVLMDSKLTAEDFNSFRSHLVDQGLFQFATPDELEAAERDFGELSDLAVKYGLMNEEEAEVLREPMRRKSE